MIKQKLLSVLLQQGTHTAAMADAPGTQKFYVVVAVIAVLFAGIVWYLIRLDQKMSKLEK